MVRGCSDAQQVEQHHRKHIDKQKFEKCRHIYCSPYDVNNNTGRVADSLADSLAGTDGSRVLEAATAVCELFLDNHTWLISGQCNEFLRQGNTYKRFDRVVAMQGGSRHC